LAWRPLEKRRYEKILRFMHNIMWVFCASDYHLATPAMAALARSEEIYKSEKFSDHAPITVGYALAM